MSLYIYGWVPNIEGRVCCSGEVFKNITEQGITKTIPENKISYTYKRDSDGKRIAVSNRSLTVTDFLTSLMPVP